MSLNSFHLPISQHHEVLVLQHFCERNSFSAACFRLGWCWAMFAGRIQAGGALTSIWAQSLHAAASQRISDGSPLLASSVVSEYWISKRVFVPPPVESSLRVTHASKPSANIANEKTHGLPPTVWYLVGSWSHMGGKHLQPSCFSLAEEMEKQIQQCLQII